MIQDKPFRIDAGRPLPLGPSITPRGINFALFSRHAASVDLVLFDPEDRAVSVEISLEPGIHKTGHIWHVHVTGARPPIRYAYRVDGPNDPETTALRFDRHTLLLDPYARAITGAEVWGAPGAKRWGCVLEDDFDWEGDRPLNIPLKDTVIYELHVRGYTIHENSGVRHPGTYRGLVEKIPYIESLGVTAVELLPLFEFDEMENKRTDAVTGEALKNYWGYGSVGFFAPKASYAADPSMGNQIREFKEMVKAFHRAGLEVILDVVFNHTAERDAKGPTWSFRGLDNPVYYALHPKTREYLNITGCGNTFNCNNPVVRSLIMDCLRYWVLEMHVDGFRFDLASVLGRDHKGDLISGPCLIDDIEQDPVLSDTKIIAEPWDPGAHQVGRFPGRWAEWNSYFRDDVRRSVRGDSGVAANLATRIAGSSDIFNKDGRSPFHGVNFVTCHDGFTLNDLVSFEKKHNERNGEDNRDGTDNNLSSNAGVEGPTDDPSVQGLRRRRIKTFLAVLMVSQGVPMVLAGDEFGRTQQGNNNPYCHDDEISWVDWRLAEENHELLRFFRMVVALRNRHPVFRRTTFLSGLKNAHGGFPDISWHGLEFNKPDWSEGSRVLAFLLDGIVLAPTASQPSEAKGPEGYSHHNGFFAIINGDREEHAFELPQLREGLYWIRLLDTGLPSPQDIVEEDQAEPISDKTYLLAPSAMAVLMTRPITRI